jgi:hypothetical protein
VSFTNNGNSNLVISSVTASGNGFSDSGGSNVALAPYQSVTVSVNFGPTAAGNVTGSLSVSSNASNAVLQISLSGNGMTQQPATHSLVIGWTASQSQVNGYNVYRGTISGGPYTKVNANVDSSDSYTDTLLTGGTYYYVVTSVSSSGTESGYSNEADAVVQ